jgi:UDP-N-acetylglucosamine 2-epimerase (non-hydrolysing)
MIRNIYPGNLGFSMKVLLVASTRPEVIKLAPVLKSLTQEGVDHVFATTGQHYDFLLFNKFVDELSLPKPKFNIEVGSGTQAIQTGKIMEGVEKILHKDPHDVVVVEGDTNSVLGSALASVKLKIPVAHVEAGLRSHDRTMPEEINRIMTDHCSEILFPPTETSALNLINEGIYPEKIHIVGNTVVDSTLSYLPVAQKSSNTLEDLPNDYFLLTLHRQENTDDPKRLAEIFQALNELNKDVIFPIHPRTSGIIEKSGLKSLLEKDSITVIPPVGYLDFLLLLKNAYTVLTDSGGVQEEAIILNTPCLTLRYNTERPETVSAGGNIVVGTKKEDILKNINALLDTTLYEKMQNAVNPFGNGKTGEKIARILVEKFNRGELAVEGSDTRDGYYSRKVLKVDGKIAGKTVSESGFKIIKVIADGTVRFPYKDLVLSSGQFIEVVKKS